MEYARYPWATLGAVISFRKRDPAVVGFVGLVLLGLLTLIIVEHDRLPIIGTSVSYSANVPEAAGLRLGDDVSVAGVAVGRVTGIELTGTHVTVTFAVRNAWLGDRTTAAIRISTIMGAKYLALIPAGDRPLDPDHAIPGMSPYDVTAALGDLSRTLGRVDTAQLGRSFAVLAQDFADTPPSVHNVLNGLVALSDTISGRDRQLSELLGNTKALSATLESRDDQITALVTDGSTLLSMVAAREQAISALLTGTQALSAQLSGLVDDDTARLRPVLTELDTFTTMLAAHQTDLANSIQSLAPFSRLGANVLGNGRWVDGYVCGLLPLSAGPVNPGGCGP